MRYFLAFLLALFSSAAQAQQTQVQWGYLAGFPSQIQFKVGPTWFPIGTFDGVTFTPTGAGTVTSVGLTAPAIFSVAGSPVTTTGVLALTLVTQTANTFLAGPTGGGAATPAFRAIVPADVPVMVGDSGAGGVAGIVAAPAAGDAAAGRVWSASGTWQAPNPTSYLTDAVSQCGADPTGVADSTSAINTCLTTFGAVGLRAGTYKTSAAISVPTNGTLCGAGEGASIISLNSTTANAVTVQANADKVYICELNIKRVGVPTGSAAGLKTDIATIITQSKIENVHVEGHQIGFYLGPTDASTCENCVSEKNYSDGFYFENNTTWNILQWQLLDVLSQKNDGVGLHFVPVAGTTNSIQGPPWIGVSTFANSGGGVHYAGAATRPINDITLQNCTLSYDGNNEIDIQAFSGAFVRIQGCLIEGAGVAATGRTLTTPATNNGNGIKISNGVSDVLIENNIITTNSFGGVAATDAIESLVISGNHVIRNSVGATHTYDGISVDGTSVSKLIVSGNSSFNVGGTEQRYGIVVSPAATSSVVSGNTAASNTAGCLLTDVSIVYGNSGTGCTGRAVVSSIPVGSAVSLPNATPTNVTSVSLPAGEWLCYGNVNFYPAGTTTVAAVVGWISSVSATVPTLPNSGSYTELTATLPTGANQSLSVGQIEFSLGATTTMYLQAFTSIGVSTMTVGGYIQCRRAL